VQLDADFAFEVSQDIDNDVGLGRRGEAQYGRNRLITGFLADESADLAIIGTKILSPLGEAVRFVEHPGANFALRKHFA